MIDFLEENRVSVNIDYKWRDAFHHRALEIKWVASGSLGFKVLWYLWSADVWFGNFPLLKALVGCNIVVWIILFFTR